jgi:chaperonin GroEL
VIKNPDPHYGYDAARDEYKDLVRAGIIDPTKVARSALENAISIAGMFLTTEALIVDTPGEKKEPMMPPGGGMGGMY